MIRDVHPGSGFSHPGSWIRTDPGVKSALDPGSATLPERQDFYLKNYNESIWFFIQVGRVTFPSNVQYSMCLQIWHVMWGQNVLKIMVTCSLAWVCVKHTLDYNRPYALYTLQPSWSERNITARQCSGSVTVLGTNADQDTLNWIHRIRILCWITKKINTFQYLLDRGPDPLAFIGPDPTGSGTLQCCWHSVLENRVKKNGYALLLILAWRTWIKRWLKRQLCPFIYYYFLFLF